MCLCWAYGIVYCLAEDRMVVVYVTYEMSSAFMMFYFLSTNNLLATQVITEIVAIKTHMQTETSSTIALRRDACSKSKDTC